MAFNQFKSSILGSSAVGLLGLSAVAFCSEAAGAQTTVPVAAPAAMSGNSQTIAAPPSNAAAPASLAAETASTSAEGDAAEITVTGTLLRGVAPVGTNVVSFSSKDVRATGLANTNDILAQIPQVNTFLTLPRPTADGATAVNRPSLRNLDQVTGFSGGSSTLILLNGHRMVGAGIISTTPDPGVLPPSVIERVEVVPDGGSSIYGSDAIAGVINFITRKRYDGVSADARFGIADHYKQYNASVIAGRDWGSGSAYVSYEYFSHDDIINSERDYYQVDLRSQGGSDFRTQNCPTPNIIAGGVTYALPGRAAGTRNLCAPTLNATFYPAEKRHSGYASLYQELAPNLTFEANGFYTWRKTELLAVAPSGARTITSANPYFQSIAGETSQTVTFTYAPAFGSTTPQSIVTKVGGATGVLNYRINDDWHASTQVNFGWSHTTALSTANVNTSLEAIALASTNTATALNPYNVAATNPTVLSALRNFRTISDGRQRMAEARASLDGSLFTLPGGAVRLAVGAEARRETLNATAGDSPYDSAVGLAHTDGVRKIYAGFGELLIPIFGSDNSVTGIEALQLSASARYDHYNDRSVTARGVTTGSLHAFNPKFGVTWKPFGGLTFRGNYGTSFNAPSLGDGDADVSARVAGRASTSFLPAGYPASALRRTNIVIVGGNPNLKPQKAKTYSFGADINPAFLRGFQASITYFNVKFRNAIATIPDNPALFATPAYSKFYFLEPSLEFVKAYTAGYRIVNVPSLESLYQNGNAPIYFADFRRNNFGTINVDGIDFNLNQVLPTGFGSISAGVAGTFTLHRTIIPVEGAAAVNDLKAGTSRFRYVANIGANTSHITTRLTFNYSQGYPLLNVVNQSRIKAFYTLDLFASYAFNGDGWARDFALSINVDNITDKDPPYRNVIGGTGNGQTLGRMVTFGISKKL